MNILFNKLKIYISTNYKKILFFLFIWYIVCAIFLITVGMLEAEIVELTWQVLLFAPILVFIIFAPTIIISRLLFKFVRKTYKRVIVLSILIPLNNLIYMFLFPNLLFSYLVGASMIFLILPLSFITVCVIPKKYFSLKKSTIVTILLTELVGIFFVYMVCEGIENIITNIELIRCNATIDALYEYKIQNGKYPEKLSVINVYKSNYFKYTEYTQLDKGNNYIYRIKIKNTFYTPAYIYTPNNEYKKELLKNEQRKYSPILYIDKGKWLFESIDD